MPQQVDDVSTLQDYLQGVVNRADHHGDNVRYVVIALVGAIVLHKDREQSIRVFTREGVTGNVLWVYIGGSQYAFAYDHHDNCIVVRRGTVHGEVLERFTNASSIPDILSAFERLRNPG